MSLTAFIGFGQSQQNKQKFRIIFYYKQAPSLSTDKNHMNLFFPIIWENKYFPEAVRANATSRAISQNLFIFKQDKTREEGGKF